MNTRYLLTIAIAMVFGGPAVPQGRAQTPQHLPPPVITAPRPIVKPPPAVVATNVAKPKAVWCPACRGRKTTGVEVEGACRSCNGSGKVVSSFSKTETPCNFCKGTGKVINIVQQPCSLCQAKGTLATAVFEQFIGCTNCTGQKVIELDVSLTCTTCNGAGKIVKTTSSGGSFGSSGGFSGKSGGKSSVSSSSAPQEQACYFCNGAGKVDKRIKKPCPTCYGAGVMPPPPPPPVEPKPE
jgi:DnaJ-class molecular chaperone